MTKRPDWVVVVMDASRDIVAESAIADASQFLIGVV